MVETFLNIEPYPSILRVEVTDQNSKARLPPFLKVLREVTNESHYETWFMANKDFEMPEDDVINIQQKLRKERDQEDLNYSQ